MKTEMTNIDINVAVNELQKVIINGKLDKTFLIEREDGKELILKIHIPEIGTREIAIGIGKYKYITMTNYERKKPKNPPSFAMLLRKYLKNIKITKIEQVDFDRIVIITFEWNETVYKLVVELFGDGNVVLLDKEDRIIMPLKMGRWSTRNIIPKEFYKFPPQRDLNPYNLDYSVAYDIFRDYFINNKDTECVRIISRIFGLAGLYAEEICERANVDKSKKDLSDDEIRKLFDATKDLFNDVFNNKKPQIIIKDGEYVDVVPINLKKYGDFEKKEYGEFLEALDDYFAQFMVKVEVKKEESKLQKLIKKQERILKTQWETLEKYEKDMQENQEKGDLIYANYMLVDEILNTLRNAREKMDWYKIKKIIKEHKDHPVLGLIQNINEKNGEIVIKLSADYGDRKIEKNVSLDIRKNAFENAETYYTKSKKLKGKLEGIKEAIKLTEKKIEELKEKEEIELKELKEKEKIKKKERKERKWYEKFKWTVINGFLVIAGKDAVTNELLIKKYTEDDDIVFHAQIEGAPFTVIKTNKRIVDEETLNEVAKFSVAHSRAWKLGWGALDTYWVKPEQISKTAESGEYLKKGAFVIRGKRNFIRNVPLELGIGVIEYDDALRLTTSPLNTLKKNFKKWVLLKPSNKKKSELVKELKNIFKEYDVDDEDILRVLPPGDSEIVYK
ncbi:ribosome rescue protein RqcH [Methanotorris formicicus]|uniref:Archaeal Rqc2 homolog aRqcH n=1 Tax=Methanotorris formicicus Mc-S-70 TaxID=647171 RepID=H1KXX4_9EURY|nr:ribosome rescue protein RqcH [Methanotorris formicicus]EHP87758.1 Fibronectin-binding A domain protein [Methanotorris formicicus Mc-S-70]